MKKVLIQFILFAIIAISFWGCKTKTKEAQKGTKQKIASLPYIEKTTKGPTDAMVVFIALKDAQASETEVKNLCKEIVKKNGNILLKRPDNNDKKDSWRLTQTHLEQVNSNSDFREIAIFFNSVRYMHLIPQLIRRPDTFFNPKLNQNEDPYGFYFLERIAKTSERTRQARLKKIENALRFAVPQLKGRLKGHLTIHKA